MKCPTCDRLLKVSPDEKTLVRRFGSVNKICPLCKEVVTVYMYNIDQYSARLHRKENGICTQCGKEKVTDGYLTCERCREIGARERAWTKALPLCEDKPKKAVEYGIDELSKMSHDMHISYGNLVAILEGRKKMPKDSD